MCVTMDTLEATFACIGVVATFAFIVWVAIKIMMRVDSE